ncbi:MAG: KH domain-containing protein [Candidatus Hodarchaeales archaeon]
MVIKSHIKIPKSRIGVLIGRKGETKAEIESTTRVSIKVNSEDGSVVIESTPETPDPTYVLKVRDIIKAIGKGFSAEKAFYLLDDDMFLETIELQGSKNSIKRHKSRIIGEKGKTRRIIESSTDASISVFGDNVTIIGGLEEIRYAKEAILQLISGSRHSTVYRFLEHVRFRSKQKPLRIWKEFPPEEN